MEREIKFRAWDNVEKEMLDTVEKWNRGWKGEDTDPDNDYDFHTKSLYVDQQGHVLEHTDEHGVCDMHFYLQGKPKYTLMQFTGLKDKNGKEIYEGDIVRTDEASWVAQVIYHRDCFMCTGLDSKGFSVVCNWENFEVIGNIYENPELVCPTPNGEGE